MTDPYPEYLKPARLQLAEAARSEYVHNAPAGVMVENLLDPEYWDRFAHKLRKHDVIVVIGPEFDLRLRVVGFEERLIEPRVHVALIEVRWCNLAIRQPDPQPIAYQTRHSDKDRWCAVNANGQEILRGYDSRAAVDAAMSSINASLRPPIIRIPAEILADFAEPKVWLGEDGEIECDPHKLVELHNASVLRGDRGRPPAIAAETEARP